MKGFLGAASVAAMVWACPALADWKNMNDQIDQTNFWVDVNNGSGICSGTLISLAEKLVLTNRHCVVDNIDKVEQEETDASGKVEKVTREAYRDMTLIQKAFKGPQVVGSTTVQAEIVGVNKKFDLALLHIRADKIAQTVAAQILPVAKTVSRGDVVEAVGNPFGQIGNLTVGHVSTTTVVIHWDEDNTDVAYYGVDAAVNPGNSGGALYNVDGELIGVPAAGVRGATGMGYAIPVESIRKFLTDNCYQDVWDTSPGVVDHAKCEQAKLDKENIIRVKAGLPPKEAPKKDSLSGKATHASSLVLKPSPWLDLLGAVR